MRTIRVIAEVKVPKVPNFLRYPGGTVRVGDVEDESLVQVADAWKEDLLARAREQRIPRGSDA